MPRLGLNSRMHALLYMKPYCLPPVCCSGGEPAMKRGGAAAAGNGRFQMGSTQQPQELTREQLLADIEVKRVGNTV